MLTTSDPQYIETKKVLRGEIQIDPQKQELMDWVSNRFGIQVLNIEYDKLEQGKRDRINVIVKTRKDSEKMHHYGSDYSGYNIEYQQEIREVFEKIYSDSNLFDFKAPMPAWVCYMVFDEAAMSELNSKLSLEKLNEIINDYSDLGIWQIIQFFGATVVFIHTQKQLKEMDLIRSESLRKRIFSEIKPGDEFDLLSEEKFTINFDTKENLDKKYDGNVLNYFR